MQIYSVNYFCLRQLLHKQPQVELPNNKKKNKRKPNVLLKQDLAQTFVYSAVNYGNLAKQNAKHPGAITSPKPE